MITHPVLQWAFTLVFLTIALYFTYRAVIDRTRPVQAVGHALHTVMSVVMVAMAWPWWISTPLISQLVFFVLATIWFLMLLVLQVFTRVTAGAALGGGPWHQLLHTLMMFAMVWMIVVMLPDDRDAAPGTGQGQPTSGYGGHSGHGSALPEWAVLSGVAVTTALLVAGTILIVEVIACARQSRRAWNAHTVDHTAGAVMSLGMAAMCWTMLVP
ncbi:DUF5134 domain-containing protein [Lysinibacter sp. HNR]|uniref:DUF5134 domain-containing protein n=1 Tax=Lysinibacter sp. HNR TaxID=3031408 RepID=UPI0024351741|nr:DUF5134 domain-containing protein [Lysinibacter sp. HNR]WGD36958.1 DUF5134 domain-containing protein [Lysinibacter sp. HNR]